MSTRSAERERGRSRSRSRSRGGGAPAAPAPASSSSGGGKFGKYDDTDRRLYVGNLSSRWSEEEMRVAFGKYGRVSDVRIVKDNVSGEPRGYAFITFAEQADAVDAQKAMDGSDGAGRVLKVSFARVQTQPRAASSFAPPGGYGGGRDRDYDRRRSSRDRSRSRDRDRRRSRSRDRRRSRSRDRHDRDRR